MGSVVLSHWSALDYWKSPHSRNAATRGCPQIAAEAILEDAVCDTQNVTVACLTHPALHDLRRPLHLLVGSSSKAREKPGLVAHCHTATLIDNSFVRISHDVYVCSPELTFVQLCQELSLEDAALLGCELSGTYRIDPFFGGAVAGLKPVTNRESLVEASIAYKSVHGTRGARIASRFVLDKSSNPLMSRVALYLTLPRLRGGEAFARPLLDHTVKVPRDLQPAMGCTAIACTACWLKQRTVLDLDPKPEEAALRREVFQRRDLKVVQADAHMLRDDEGLDHLVAQLSRCMKKAGHRPNGSPRNYEEKRAHLRGVLLREGDIEPDGNQDLTPSP